MSHINGNWALSIYHLQTRGMKSLLSSEHMLLQEYKKHSDLILYILNHIRVLNSHLCLRIFILPVLAYSHRCMTLLQRSQGNFSSQGFSHPISSRNKSWGKKPKNIILEKQIHSIIWIARDLWKPSVPSTPGSGVNCAETRPGEF